MQEMNTYLAEMVMKSRTHSKGTLVKPAPYPDRHRAPCSAVTRSGRREPVRSPRQDSRSLVPDLEPALPGSIENTNQGDSP